jgi:hypothetical protein
MSQVFVLDTNKRPLDPVHPGRARLLLKQGKAAVYRRYPFTLILKHTLEQPMLRPLRVKIDPGSHTTGLALVNDASGQVVWAAELSHRGEQIEGLEYQQGTLCGYEVREYVLLKWNHQCAYCDARDVPLELDHVQPRAKRDSNRVSNLTLACTSCNQRKSNQDVRTFLKEQPERLARLLAHLRAPLVDAAAVNTTRWAMYQRLTALGLPVECGSGGLTKYNRVRRDLAKMHWLDAACVGDSTPQVLDVRGIVPLRITATGHGSRQMCRMDKYGFPRTGPKQHKRVQGFQTGDLVRAVVTSGSRQGTYVGKVAVRSRGTFNITTAHGVVTDIHHRWCRLVARADGYTYQHGKEAVFPPSE